MKRLTVAFDIDDVIIDLVPQWLRVYNMVYNDNLQPEQITDWNIKSFTKPKSDIYDVLKRWHDYSLCDLIEDSFNGVNYFRSLGHRVIFITSTPKEHEGVKLDYLNKRGFKIRKNNYFETKDKHLIPKDFLIDDNFENIQKTNGKGILFTRYWNKKYNYEYRVNSWKDLIEKWNRGDFQ